MNCLFYTMINKDAGVDEIKALVDLGAKPNDKMANNIDLLDLIIYTQNSQ